MLPAAPRSDGTYHAPSHHQLGWIEATWDHPLLHPAHARQTSPEIFHSGQSFRPGKDKRDALGGEQCQLKRSGRETTAQATPQAAEGDRSSNVASFLCWHKRWEQNLPRGRISGHWLPQKRCCSLSGSLTVSLDRNDFVQASEVWSSGLLLEAWTPQTDPGDPLHPTKSPGTILINEDDLFYHTPSPANPKKGKPK